MKKLIIFGIILLICVNMAIAEQVRVIDKITVEKVTVGNKPHSTPRIYNNKLTWIESDDEEIQFMYKNLNSGEVKVIDSVSKEGLLRVGLLNFFENYIVYVKDTGIWVVDINTNQKYTINEGGQDRPVNHITYSDKKIIYDCDLDRVCIYDLATKNTENIKIPEAERRLNNPFVYNYPYIYFQFGLYNLKTEEFIKTHFGAILKIIDNKLLFISSGQLVLYNPENDKKEIYLKTKDVEIEWGYAKEYNKIFVSRGKHTSGGDSDNSELNIYDGKQNKLYSIKSGDFSTDYDIYDDKIVFVKRNENTGSLKYPIDTQIYLATLHFKYIDIEVNETKLPLTKEIETEEITIVEKSVGEPTIYQTEIQGCTKDSQCEEGFCDVETGHCVECYNGVCDCQESYKSCLGKTCVKIKSKEAGDFYKCEFECKSGLSKNGQCIDPITVKLSTTKETVRIGEGTDITISFDNALDYTVDADLTVTSGNGVSISSSEACQSGSRNLCKSFHKIGAKEVKQLSIRVDCIDSIKNIPIEGKITYTAGDLSTTIEKTIEIDCIKRIIVQKGGFFDRLFGFFRGIFS